MISFDYVYTPFGLNIVEPKGAVIATIKVGFNNKYLLYYEHGKVESKSKSISRLCSKVKNDFKWLEKYQ